MAIYAELEAQPCRGIARRRDATPFCALKEASDARGQDYRDKMLAYSRAKCAHAAFPRRLAADEETGFIAMHSASFLIASCRGSRRLTITARYRRLARAGHAGLASIHTGH